METSLVNLSQETLDSAVTNISKQYNLSDEEIAFLKVEIGRLPIDQKFHIIGLCLRIKTTLDVLGKPEISKPLITQLFNGRSEDVLKAWDRLFRNPDSEQ